MTAATPSRRGPEGARARTRPDGSNPRQDRRRRASAGRILGVALVCFGLWTLFDSTQLYRAAEASPLGMRRSVAMSLLRPISAVASALRLSDIVESADSALGRCGTTGGLACGKAVTIPVVPPPPAPAGSGGGLPSGLRPSPHFGGRSKHRIGGAVAPSGLPPLASPSAAHPLTLLSIGDSIGEDLGLGLADVFSNDPAVHVVQAAKEATGLARADYYDWPAQLESDLRQYHPAIVEVMLGTNDFQAFYDTAGNYLPFESTAWWAAYRQRVALVMDEALAAGARVEWVGLPPMGAASSVPAGFPQKLDALFAAEASAHRGVSYFSSWRLLSAPGGGFTEVLDVGGSLEQVRYSDGVHLAPAGYDLLARAVVPAMERAFRCNLGA